MFPSTRLHIRPYTVHRSSGRTKQGRQGRSEDVRGGRTSYTTVSDISF